MPLEGPDSGAIVENAYPLSPLQKGMLLNTLLDPGSGVEIVQIVNEFHESLDVAVFQRAWRCAIARHPVLRTGFRWENLAEPLQEVRAHVDLPWEEQDWRGTPDAERSARMAEFLDSDRRRGFSLARAPLFRLTSLLCAEAEFRFVVTFHHAVLEGRSYVLLVLEVFAFYEAFRAGRHLDLPLPRPYSEYVEWLQRQDFSRHESFWRERLRGFVAPTPLAIDHAPDPRGFAGPRKGILEAWLPEQTTVALRMLAKENQITLNTIVQGAWALLLSRYSGETDVIFGAVRANRRSSVEGADTMIGVFINTLPLRIRVNPDSTLIEWLHEVRLRWTELQDHEQTPLAKVHAWSDVGGSGALFQSTVVFENYRMDALLRRQGGGWQNRRCAGFMQTNHALGLGAYDGKELSLRLDFDRSRVDDADAGRTLSHLQTLLEAFGTHSRRKLAEFSLLGSAERQQLLLEWNQTRAEYPRDRLVDELFEQQARSTPERVALVFEQQQLTYRELDERADQLARRLRVLGTRPGVLVGLYVERSLDMAVGLLGTLKSGAAYMPLDPAYPAERLAFMVEDARPLVLLTQETLLGRVPPGSAGVICLDAPATGTSRDEDPPVCSPRRSSDLAYVLYTSGSTGKPKGVEIPHRALVNLLSAMRRAPGLAAADTLLAVTTLSFDIAALELFLPLISGARMVIAGSEVVADGAQLSSLLKTCKATVMQATPATWRLLLAAGWQGAPNLKILCGGEAWSAALAKELLPRCESLWNMYGPTETTIWSSASEVKPGEPVLIGAPIANTTFYVLQADCQPAPIGIPGELCIGGDGVAHGYLNRPELTTERFIRDPFGLVPGAHLYKTGDRVRRLRDGRIEFLGRTDHQIKLRGFRIELEEIEAAIARHPAVKQAVVIAREDTPGDRRLAAYLVAENPPTDLAEQLRALLRAWIPPYMVPAHFVRMDALPLTPNGKLDRKSLPNPNETDGALRPSAYVPPRSDLEVTLAAVWEGVLGVRRVGITDNFFDLGGDSFGVLKLISEMEHATGIAIGLGAVFETPTIAALVESMAVEATENASLVVPLQRAGNGVPIFCLLGINLYRHFAESLGTEQPVFGVYVVEEQALANEAIKGGRPDVSTERLAEAYRRAISRFRPDGPYRLAGLSMGGILAMEVAARIRARGGAVDLVILFDTWLPQGIHRNWRKWVLQQAVQGMDAYARRKLRSLLEDVRKRFAKIRLPPATQKHSRKVDHAVVLRSAAFVQAIRKWRAHHLVFDFRVLLFRASDRSIWGPHIEFDEDYGWRRYLSGSLSIVDVPGNHTSIMEPPRCTLLGSLTRQHLRPVPDAQAPGAGDASAN